MRAFFLLLAVGAVRLSTEVARTDDNEGTDPVSKVIRLLGNLRTKVQNEGASEASTYESFACFCKNMTENKTTEIENGKTAISGFQSTLKSKTALRDQTMGEIKDEEADERAGMSEMQEAADLRAREKAVYTVAYADSDAAFTALGDAETVLTNSKPDLVEMKATVTKALLLGKAAGFLKQNSSKALALISADPDTWEQPDNEYEFHSDDLIGTIQQLRADFRKKRNDLRREEEAAVTAFHTTSQAKQGEIDSIRGRITSKNGLLSRTKGEITQTQSDLDSKQENLEDDQAYLKDLTQQCEQRARQWDQRAQMRADELEAITKAVNVLSGTVQGMYSSATSGHASATMLPQVDVSDDADPYEDVVFIQEVHNKVVKRQEKKAMSETGVRNHVITIVKNEAKKQKSMVLELFAMKLASDPFAKVKTLIQGLIERLLEEAANEATQKGWCDTEMTMAREDRNYRQADVEDINAEIEKLESRQQKLNEDKTLYNSEIFMMQNALGNATNLRQKDKEDNMDTLNDANDGLTALNKAIVIIEEFYKKAGRAQVELVQKDSPVDTDIATEGADAGFDGAYTGNQDRAQAIVSLLQTIKADFERTIKSVQGIEDQSNSEFVTFRIEMEKSIQSKKTSLEHTEDDLVLCADDLQQNIGNLKAQQDLLDTALKQLEALKPTCVDTGMSYAERVQRRQAEIDALKKAMCTLDADTNEYEGDCKNVDIGFLQKS